MTNQNNPSDRARGFVGGHGRDMGIEKAKDFKGTMKQLLIYLKPFRLHGLIVILFAIGSTILTVIGPKILGNATTLLAEGIAAKLRQTGGIDFVGLARILVFLMMLYIVSALCSYVQHFVMSSVTQKVSYQLRKSLAEKINRMPFSYFDKTTHGEVLSRVSNDVDTISRSLNQSLQQILTSLVSILGVLLMMISISWQMTLMALLVIPCSGIFASLIIKRSQRHFKQQQQLLGEVNGHVEEMYGGHLVMKAFNGEEKSVMRFENLNHQLYDAAWKSQFLSGMMQPITGFVGNLGYVGVCLLGGILAIDGAIQIGDIQAFITYVRQFNQPITQTAQIMNVLQSTAAAAERVFEFLNEPEQLPETAHPLSLYDDEGKLKIKGEVCFDHVCFGYTPNKIIIHDFSARVPAGSRVAIVGPTGAGKTTMVKLLMRFYELNSGAIAIDGQNITAFTRSDLRSLFGMVLQDAWLFSGTIMENIRYGNREASDEEVKRAADLAYVDHFIRTLENGYQTTINEESTNISQGHTLLFLYLYL